MQNRWFSRWWWKLSLGGGANFAFWEGRVVPARVQSDDLVQKLTKEGFVFLWVGKGTRIHARQSCRKWRGGSVRFQDIPLPPSLARRRHPISLTLAFASPYYDSTKFEFNWRWLSKFCTLDIPVYVVFSDSPKVFVMSSSLLDEKHMPQSKWSWLVRDARSNLIS